MKSIEKLKANISKHLKKDMHENKEHEEEEMRDDKKMMKKLKPKKKKGK